MARSPLQMRMATGRAALPKNLAVQSGSSLAGYLTGGPKFTYASQQRQKLGVQSGGALGAYLTGGVGALTVAPGGTLAGYLAGPAGVSQQLTIKRGGSLAAYLRRDQRRRYDPDQPRQPRGRPEGGEWMSYTAVQRVAFLRRIGRTPFEITPEMEDEIDVDLSPFERQLSAGGLMVLGAVIAGIVAAYRAFMAEQQQQNRWRLPAIPTGRSTTLNFGGSAPQTPGATRIR